MKKRINIVYTVLAGLLLASSGLRADRSDILTAIKITREATAIAKPTVQKVTKYKLRDIKN